MKLNITKYLLACGLGASVLCMPSCSLDEINYGGDSLENLGTSPVGFEQLLNSCYFGMIRAYYNQENFMPLTEANSDLWTVAGNVPGKNDEYFKLGAGSGSNVTYTADAWNNAYDGIGACNMALKTVGTCSFSSAAERNNKEAIARFMRAMYYYHLVELFGGVPLQTSVGEVSYTPSRTEPIEVYRQVIIPDLKFAMENLYVGNYDANTTPTKKSAMGFYVKACLATQQYGTTEFLQDGFDVAKDMISDCEGGGGKYMTYMYPTFDEVFKEANNHSNKEALWKYWLLAENKSFYGCNRGAGKLNQNDERFQADVYRFKACIYNCDYVLAGNGNKAGNMMPTRHLLNLFVQDDNSLDPRFHKSFRTDYLANSEYKWNEGDIENYKKDNSILGNTIESGDVAVRFVMPQDGSYANEIANRGTSNYILVDYKDIYDDSKNDIIMNNNKGGENSFRYLYPSLSKHNSTNYFVQNASKVTVGNMNGILVMRMAEIYLLAAEYDILLNGGSGAMAYINKVRTRAGAKPLSGSATIRTVLDERGRELCGEFTRFYDLKRTGMLKDASYLQSTHPDLAKYFKPEYALHPIPQAYLDVVTNGGSLQNPGYNSKK